ncbi:MULTISPECIES: AMP-dependent synthetase/ligase [Prauserella salsuginis group]|uniref:Acyl-CoA synthetase n=1 Tax=Prauserella salsuginis TaxID=387889 RepID=A0ABW6G441_9PSEU|nr:MULTISPECIES: AMP-dependent synthetase/ligase [Prauserella salsuginis group]MCR3718324.1 long-chain acyl-CoA synthetase [Prauserella flava]MCR3732894.1 long-chain acyl-CoA synthetase [Prauserella salsuginis]
MLTESDVRASLGDATVPSLVRRNAERCGDKPALSGSDGTHTWADVREQIAAVAHGLSAAGLGRGDRMLIDVTSRPEHWIVDFAAVHLGALPCTTYATLSTEQIRHVATHSAATVVVLEGAAQLHRWRPVLDALPNLRAVVVLDAAEIPEGESVFVSYDELRRGGADLHRRDPAAVERWADTPRQSDPVCMIYTSGTTGAPKGVVLSHENVLYQAAAQELIRPVEDHPRMVAYLPLAHVAERVLGMYLLLLSAGHATVCPDQAQLVPTLQKIRPHGFFGVPRVWEKIAAGIQGILGGLPEDQRAAIERAREVAATVYGIRADGGEPAPEVADAFDRADRAVLRPLREQLGLGEAERLGSGAAPIPASVLEFFGSLGMTIMEVWGLSETTGAATSTLPTRYRAGTVGMPMPGMAARIAEDGEVEVRGPLVFLGYLDDDGGIRRDTDADGWLATGDIGSFDEDGFLTITDRKKELIITSSGKNVSPSKAEGLLRTHPLVGCAAVIGDQRPYVTALLTLDEESAPAWAKARGIDTTDLAELAEHPDVLAALADAVETANAELARPEQIKNHRVLPQPWTPESGELTPTMKLKRRVISDRYASAIASLYADGKASTS